MAGRKRNSAEDIVRKLRRANELAAEGKTGEEFAAELEARVVIGDFKEEPNHQHRHSALGYRTPVEYAAVCRCIHTPDGLQHQLNLDR